MNYAISFNKKTAILIFAGGTVFGMMLFLSGYKLGFDRGSARTRAQMERPPAPPTAEPASASLTAGAAEAPSTQGASGSAQGPSASNETPPAEPAVGAPASKDGYSVQISVFQTETPAQELQQRIARRGYSAYVFHGPDSAGQTWYAVRIGHFKDLAPATRAAVNFTMREKLPAHVRPDNAL